MWLQYFTQIWQFLLGHEAGPGSRRVRVPYIRYGTRTVWQILKLGTVRGKHGYCRNMVSPYAARPGFPGHPETKIDCHAGSAQIARFGRIYKPTTVTLDESRRSSCALSSAIGHHDITGSAIPCFGSLWLKSQVYCSTFVWYVYWLHSHARRVTSAD
jgi:hypothetical protein